MACIIKHDYDSGLADLEWVIREAPDRAEAHAWCAKAYFLRADFPGAVKEFTEAIAIHPRDKQTYNDRGMAHFQAGAHADAIADFDRAIEPRSPVPRCLLESRDGPAD